MSRIVFLNGKYIEYSNATVHVEDRGYQFADGVYEVFSVNNSKIIDYKEHIERLYKSLNEIKLTSPINKKSYYFHVKNIIKKNLINNGLIYLQVTRGVSQRDFKFPKNVKASVIIIGRSIQYNQYDQQFSSGIKVKTVKDMRWKRVDIKTINLLAPVLAKQSAAIENCEEAWLIDEDGYVTEGSSSTAWILKNNTLFTTPLSNSILNGITRKSLIRGLKKNNLKIVEKKFNIMDIKNADEAYITSATQYVMPVIKVDNFKIGKGIVGKNAKIFRKMYMEAVKLT